MHTLNKLSRVFGTNVKTILCNNPNMTLKIQVSPRQKSIISLFYTLHPAPLGWVEHERSLDQPEKPGLHQPGGTDQGVPDHAGDFFFFSTAKLSMTSQRLRNSRTFGSRSFQYNNREIRLLPTCQMIMNNENIMGNLKFFGRWRFSLKNEYSKELPTDHRTFQKLEFFWKSFF